MSKKLDVSDPSALSAEDLRWAFDRGLISGETYESVAGVSHDEEPSAPSESDEPPTEPNGGTPSEVYDLDKDLEEWTIPQIQQYLTDNDVEFKKSASKGELIELAAAV